jgi:hypothetical protein
MNLSTYRFLDRSVRIGPLTVLQWVQVVAALPLVFGLSQLFALVMPASWALSTALTLAGSPLAITFVAMEADFDVPAYLRAAIQYRRGPKLLLPGTDPAAAPRGYQLLAPSKDPSSSATGRAVAITPGQMEGLWS